VEAVFEMTDKQNTKKLIKEIQKELDKLKEDFKKMELRPCHGDADLRQREKDLEELKQRIYALEKERDQYLYTP
jgi:septal ring factor EnvC (AmiA/AmiB activator)